MEHVRRYILTDWAWAPPFNSPCGLSTLKVRKFRRFRCVKLFCYPIHCPLEDGQTCCFGWPKPNKLCFHIRLVFCSFHIQRAVLVEELGLDCFGCTWSCRHVKCWLFQQAWLADELFVKPMRFWSKSWVETWMNTEQLPFVFFATQKLSNLAQVYLFIVVVTDFPHHKRFHICRILQIQLFVLLYW